VLRVIVVASLALVLGACGVESPDVALSSRDEVAPLRIETANAVLLEPVAGEPVANPSPSPSPSPAPSPADRAASATRKTELEVAALLLPRLNALRTERGLPPLIWSAELEQSVHQTAEEIERTGCTHAQTRRALDSMKEKVSYRWTGGVRRFDGSSQAQNMAPAYIVSEWESGKSEYDPVTQACWRSGRCAFYAPIVSPNASKVGCAHKLCSSNDQVWICLFGD
jgi:hypothetical protein